VRGIKRSDTPVILRGNEQAAPCYALGLVASDRARTWPSASRIASPGVEANRVYRAAPAGSTIAMCRRW
jgi:hypothetical protein